MVIGCMLCQITVLIRYSTESITAYFTNITMQVSLEVNPGSYAIHAYESGEITVKLPFGNTSPLQDDKAQDLPDSGRSRHETLRTSLIISPTQLIRNWPPQGFDDLKASHFKLLSELEPEIILFGSGDTLRWPAPALLAPLIDSGIGVEIMDTGAACRTYNILMADGRKFLAALLVK